MQVAACTAAPKKNGEMGLLAPFLAIEKFLDHLLHEGNSSETTNVDNIMLSALVDATVAEAPLNGSLGSAYLIHVQPP